MTIKDLHEFRDLIIKSNTPVSEVEFTKDNYNHGGKLIKKGLPTITTDFCEMGLFNDEIYFVFIIESETFSVGLFDNIKEKSGINIYGYTDFHTTFYPNENLTLNELIEKVQEDKYLQIQFDFQSSDLTYLFKEYTNLISIFKKNKAVVINQLTTKLPKIIK